MLSELGKCSAAVVSSWLGERTCVHLMPLADLFMMEDVCVCVYKYIHTHMHMCTYICPYLSVPGWEVVQVIFCV